MSVRGVIVVLLCRLGLPADVARRIYNLRRAEYDATYWWLMGRHYTIAARHKLIWRRPMSLGGGYGHYLMVTDRLCCVPRPWPGRYFTTASMFFPNNREAWLGMITREANAYGGTLGRTHLASRALLTVSLLESARTGAAITGTHVDPAALYVNGAAPFAEFALWGYIGLGITCGSADCYDRVYDAVSTLGITNEHLVGVWIVLEPLRLELLRGRDYTGATRCHAARVMSESDYSGWMPPK